MVKCSECGFLSLRNVTTRELEEVEKEYRESSNPEYSSAGYLADRHDNLPVCFAQACDLIAEYAFGDMAKTMQKERECNSYTKWQQGFSPKEHREMQDRQLMIELEEKRRNNDRKWHWIELIAIILGTGLFTLLGAWIARMN